MAKIKALPIILGSDENAYACARMFYEITGEKSLLLCSKPLPQTSFSGILCRTVIPDFDREEVFFRVMGEMLPIIKAENDKVMLVPCSDYYASLVIKNARMLSEYVCSPILPYAVYQRFKDKIAFSRLCRELGVAHPKTEIVSPCALLANIGKRSYPLVLKVANSNSFQYLHSVEEGRKKVYFCDSEASLRSALESLIKIGYNGAAVLQEYIPGGQEYSRVVNAYCDASGRVRLIGAGIPLLEYKNDREIGNYAVIKTVSDRRLCDEAAAILETVGYVGYANFDVKISPESGENIFLELNPRQGRSSYYMRLAGENLMLALYEDAVLEKEYEGRRYAEGDAVWINEPVSVIRREMSRQGLEFLPEISSGRGALEITYDFSFPRMATLMRRRIGAYLKEI